MIEYLEWRCYMLVDFHMHSIFSDGVETPKDLLQHAIDCNVSMMALTDHDAVSYTHLSLQQLQFKKQQ